MMAVALKHIGLDADAVTSASLAMTRQLSHNRRRFPSVRRANEDVQTGALKPIGDIMASVNQNCLRRPTLRSATRTGCGSMAGSGQRSWAS